MPAAPCRADRGHRPAGGRARSSAPWRRIRGASRDRSRHLAAALPGGNLLDAAIRAGETPSPDMVAASGATEGLEPRMAWALLVIAGLASAAAIALGSQALLWRHAAPERSPDALAEDARDLLASLGRRETVADRASGFVVDVPQLQHLEAQDPVHWRSQTTSPSFLRFWYRESPRPLEAWRFPFLYGNVSRITRYGPAARSGGDVAGALRPGRPTHRARRCAAGGGGCGRWRDTGTGLGVVSRPGRLRSSGVDAGGARAQPAGVCRRAGGLGRHMADQPRSAGAARGRGAARHARVFRSGVSVDAAAADAAAAAVAGAAWRHRRDGLRVRRDHRRHVDHGAAQRSRRPRRSPRRVQGGGIRVRRDVRLVVLRRKPRADAVGSRAHRDGAVMGSLCRGVRMARLSRGRAFPAAALARDAGHMDAAHCRRVPRSARRPRPSCWLRGRDAPGRRCAPELPHSGMAWRSVGARFRGHLRPGLRRPVGRAVSPLARSAGGVGRAWRACSCCWCCGWRSDRKRRRLRSS